MFEELDELVEKFKSDADELVKKLKAEVPTPDCSETTEPVEPVNKRWRAIGGGEYWFIDGWNDAYSTRDDWSVHHNTRYRIGNYYRTEEEATKARDRQLAIVKINDRILELNGVKTGDWAIAFSKDSGDFCLKISYLDKFADEISFLAETKHLDILREELLPELKLVFGVED